MKPAHWLLGGGVVLAGAWLWKMNRTASRLVPTPLFRAPRFPDFQRVVFPLDVKIKNPTGGGLKINWPFVELSYNGAYLGSSQAIEKTVNIAAHSETVLTNLEIEVPLLSLSTMAKPLWEFIRGRLENLPIEVRIASEADAGLALLPVNFSQTINLSRNGSTE